MERGSETFKTCTWHRQNRAAPVGHSRTRIRVPLAPGGARAGARTPGPGQFVTQIPQKRRGRYLRRHEPDLNAEKYELEEHELTQAS